MAALRDASELLWPAVAETISQLDLTEADAGVKKLAQRYAQIIDQHNDPAWCARWLFPLVLDCLEQLGATPAARARLKGGSPKDAPVSQIAKLRAARKGLRSEATVISHHGRLACAALSSALLG